MVGLVSTGLKGIKHRLLKTIEKEARLVILAFEEDTQP
jgi:hypothetical protein